MVDGFVLIGETIMRDVLGLTISRMTIVFRLRGEGTESILLVFSISTNATVRHVM
jgi:hypothetical protein